MSIYKTDEISNVENRNNSDKKNISPLSRWILSYGATHQKTNTLCTDKTNTKAIPKRLSSDEKISRLASLVYILQKENFELKQKNNKLKKL